MTVTVDHFTVRFGSITALDDVSAAVAPGRMTVLVGPNASGKSTLLRACIGAIRPQSGHVSIDGEKAHRLSPRVLARRAAYVPQRGVVSSAFTVREVLEIGRFALPASATRIEWAIQEMKLAGLEDRVYAHLSVGQQQRVTLGRALAQSSEGGCLILDEPTSAMDLHHMLEAMRLLRRLAIGGATVLMAMHDFDAAAHFADDVWMLSAGRLVAAGPAQEVLTPERLQRVFGAPFRRLAINDRESRVLAVFDGSTDRG